MKLFRILIVDDNRSIHEDFEKTLCNPKVKSDEIVELEKELFDSENTIESEPAKNIEIVEYNIDHAYQGEEAVQAVKDSDYNIVLMDYHMPKMDGIEATQKIRESEIDMGRRQTPIIALTADVEKGTRDNLYDVGIDGFISKPINKKILVSKIAKYLKGSNDGPEKN